MARSIGTVEVGVDANTGRLKAQMRVSGESSGRSWKSAFEDEIGDVSGRELLARLKLIRLKAEQDLRNIEVDVGLDDSEARRNIRELEARLRAAELEIGISPEVDDEKARSELRALRAMLRDIRLDVETELDIADIIAAKELMDETLGDIEVDVEPDIPTGRLAALRARLEAWGGDAGGGAGRRGGGSFMSGFANSFSDGSEVAIRAVALFGDNVYAALEGPIGAAAALVSSLSFALGGAGGLVITSIGNIGAAAAAAMVGLEGFGTAIGEINDEFEESRRGDYTSSLVAALANLSPNARAAARAFGDVRSGLRDAREEIQEELFSGLDTTIRDLARFSLPGITGALKIAADSVNEFVRELAEVSNNIDWVGTMQELDPSLDNMFQTATDLMGVLPGVFVAAAPASERITRAVSDAVADFREWVELNPEKLEDFFTDGANSLERWVGLIGSIGDLLGTVFGGGRGTGDNFVRSLERMFTRWDTWLESVEGQNALDEFFSDVEQTIRDIEPLFDGLGEFMRILSEESGGEQFAGLMDSMETAMPTIANALALIGDLGIGEVFLDMLSALNPVFDLLNSMPDEVLKLVGSFIAVDRVMRLASRAIQGLGVNMAAANPWLTAVGIALTGAVFAYDLFSGRNRHAEAATAEFESALESSIQDIVAAQEAATPAAAAIEAMTEAFGQGDVGSKLKTALGNLGTTLDQVAPDLVNFREGAEGAEDALAGLAEGAGLPAGPARELAAIVNATDDNFREWGVDVGGMGGRLKQLADDLGIPEESLLAMARNLEAVQDEATNVDLKDISRDAIELARGSDEATAALAAQALEAQGLAADTDLSKLSTEQLTAVYTSYIEALYEAEGAARANSGALLEEQSSYLRVQDSIALAREESVARAEALVAERQEAFRTYRQGVQEARALQQAVRDVAAEDFGIPRDAAQGIIELGEAWDEASAAATAYTNAIEVLRGGLPDLESAWSDVNAASDTFREGVTETTEGIETRLRPALATLRDTQGEVISVFDLADEVGREYAGNARSWADDILAFGAASIQAGQDTDVVKEAMAGMREELVQSIIDLGVGEQEARDYVDTLLGTPDELNTVITTPGLIDALLNAEDLTLLYDEAGNPVITEFEALGIDPAIADSEAFRDLIEVIDGTDASVTVSAGTDGAVDAIEGVQTDVEDLDETTAEPGVEIVGHIIAIALVGTLQEMVDKLADSEADPTIKVTSYTVVKTRLDTLIRTVDKLDDSDADPELFVRDYTLIKTRLDTLIDTVDDLDDSDADPRITLPDYFVIIGRLDAIRNRLNGLPDVDVRISLPGIENRISEVRRLREQINLLQNKTVTIRTNNVNTTTNLAGSMSGELITGPTVRQLGEFGYREAVIPLDLPLNRVDPSVRDMAALLRGELGSGRVIEAGPSKPPVNLYVTPQSSDPEVVAEQVINRIADRLS